MDSTVVKAFAVLEALANGDKPYRLTDLARDLKLAKSNTHRLLKTLEALGYVRQRPEDACYEATLRCWEMGVRVLSRLDVRQVARPWLVALARDSGESVHLSRFDNGETVYLDKIESTHAVRAYTVIGGRSPAYATATGKALLAHQPEAVIAEVAANLTAFTPRTLADAAALRTQLALVRRDGFAANVGEWRPAVHGLAAPIFDEQGKVVAAVGISGLGERLRGKALLANVPAVTRAAADISRQLGFVASDDAVPPSKPMSPRPDCEGRRRRSDHADSRL